MSELQLISPLLDDFDTGGSISEHNGVTCYPAMRKESTDRYIIKKVSIPASQTQLDALLLTGAYPDNESALVYFRGQAEQTVEELEVLKRLSELEGFFSYDAWQVAPKKDSVGYDVYMIGTYKYSLRKYLQHQPATHLAAINLGLDICSALSVCRRLGYMYADLKPNNIYVEDHSFRIGDIGFLKLDTLQFAILPDKYCSQYSAPEALDPYSTISSTLDIYALGLILYQIYNGGALPAADQLAPGEKFPAPAHADYEMAEIILKACDLNPDERWQDPVEMAKALIGYMQRNGANDTPIVPPVVILPELDTENFVDENADSEITSSDLESVDADTAKEEASFKDGEDLPNDQSDPNNREASISEDQEYREDDFGNLSFLDDLLSDETSPENNLTDVDYSEISDELSEILNQADALVSVPVPETVITVEETSIDSLEASVIAEIEEEQSEADEEEVTDEDDNGNQIVSVDNDTASMDQTLVVQPITDSIDSDESEEADDAQDDSDETVTEQDSKPVSKKKQQVTNWILAAVIFILIAAIAAVGFFYYQTIYLLPINSITVDGNESNMVVFVETEIDETLLSVICSDSHGNQISAPVVNGTATFANLTPDTAYNVRIMVDGFHRLTGETAASYSTPAQTNIAQFNAVTGAENGSVILSFTLEGPDSGNWKLQYSAPEEETVIVDVLSHMITLTDLTIGKEYTFTLLPSDDMYVTGNTEITHVASNLVQAENVTITSCTNNQLTVVWDSPADSDVTSWTVRCYDDVSYNQTSITSENFMVFEDIDPSSNYTVEVIAAGMSVSERAHMTANAITISDFVADTTNPEVLSLSWKASQPVPADGWVLLYSVEGTDAQGTVACSDNAVQISPVIPNTTYNIKIQQADGTAVLSEAFSCRSAIPQDFSGYGMTRSTMSYQLCRTPGETTWKWDEIPDADYTTTFNSGDSIGLIGKLDGQYGLSDDEIITMFVIHDIDGNFITYSSESRTWNDIWNKSYAEFNISQVPAAAGDYTVAMYFNGKFVTQKAFTITE